MRPGRPILFLLVILISAAAEAFQATPVRVADAECAKCHKEICQRYLSTPMAHASGTAAENLMPGTFFHVPSGVEYVISNDHGQPRLGFRSRKDTNISGENPLGYFLGSGHLGTTYLYEIDRYLFESPVAWYAASHSYDMKPGLAQMTQMPPSLLMESSCLRCHMSGVEHSDTGTINRYSGLPFLHTGITCEACHGDAQRHMKSSGKAAIVNPARLDPTHRDSVCINCHLEGDVSVERAGHSALDYHPGDSISDYLAFYVYSGTNLTTRGVSEVEQLAQSTCKRMSGDRMSCTSCHDPHFAPARCAACDSWCSRNFPGDAIRRIGAGRGRRDTLSGRRPRAVRAEQKIFRMSRGQIIGFSGSPRRLMPAQSIRRARNYLRSCPRARAGVTLRWHTTRPCSKVGLAMNLARVQCMAGDAAGARATLERALVYAPGLQELRHMRDQMRDCGPKNRAAAQ